MQQKSISHNKDKEYNTINYVIINDSAAMSRWQALNVKQLINNFAFFSQLLIADVECVIGREKRIQENNVARKFGAYLISPNSQLPGLLLSVEPKKSYQSRTN